ncbi:MAG: nitroreductase [Betaproteobacteria bacterium]|nr:nitroreductase [Betaproteobacteria bacterium]MDH4325851.1 nitroreductase [Betaproteobacteria bacterium]MDH5577620.1 nitroreductase [Betaproteobacteria bacterium]
MLSRYAGMKLLEHAVLAPSSHNTQPWRFRPVDDGIDLLADRTRALPVNDPEDRELTISCGCALFNLRVAAAAGGLSAHVSVTPDPSDADWLARVALAERAGAAAGEGDLLAYIARRRTYRKRFAAQPVAAGALAALAQAAAAEGAWLEVLSTEAQRHGAASLVAEGDAMLWSNPSWRRELAAWMHPRRRGDGLALPGLAVPVAQAVVRTFDMGEGVGAKDRQLAEASPVLAVLGTAGDSTADWLRAGQALLRLLLEGVRQGLQASYLNQPIQVSALRPRVQQLAGHAGQPQLLLRLGVPAEEVPAAPRRPLADVIDQE